MRVFLFEFQSSTYHLMVETIVCHQVSLYLKTSNVASSPPTRHFLHEKMSSRCVLAKDHDGAGARTRSHSSSSHEPM